MLAHKHEIKKTRMTFVEFDDVVFAKLATDINYFGEGNSKNRRMEFDFEYCLGCNLRLLDGKPIMTQSILEDEFEPYVAQAKYGNYQKLAEVTVQHSDFGVLENLIKAALGFGKLRAKTDV
ncbi:MAG: hypothetical protein LBH74_05610 [Nitrososphaerota archaeon]|jgi:hypothetical protein|uniref:hypothetical protein n=1 Tax=Candidatus Bathycorpusculum sp. TaxID=2994959 RepID=UPI00282FDC52|nr:hypothetical protein [Candidatus Termitimicrobium sp.]MCL2432264.1 hypothetical protein [Candidatus Termitimicrobium sp.]MDR0493096.1 hypothetical protein [Nitrososphaerota archaeon]